MEVKPSDTTRRLGRPLPISVIVPHDKRREKFFYEKCLPSIKHQNPAQLVIVDRDGGAAEKRNEGSRSAIQPFVFFCDDDVILRPGCLETMYNALFGSSYFHFAYSDFEIVVHEGLDFPGGSRTERLGAWHTLELAKGNQISMMSLLRRESFPGFDENLRRFQDWDLWLTMRKRGLEGVCIPTVLFELHQFDRGITMSESAGQAEEYIRRKHGI